MDDEQRITLEEVINIIGDEVGKKYTWFLVSIDAQGDLSEFTSNGEIRELLSPRKFKLGYCELSWETIKEMSKRLSAVVGFHLIGSVSKDDFLKERSKLNLEVFDWSNIVCQLDFFIEDGEIWEINGKDEFLVKRLKKTFSKLPTLLM